MPEELAKQRRKSQTADKLQDLSVDKVQPLTYHPSGLEWSEVE